MNATASERGQSRRARLNREYDNVNKVPGFDFKAYLAALDAENHAARKTYAKALRADLPYGSTPAETLDVFVVNPGGPLHVFYHGGYWRMLHKNDFTYLAHGILPHGHNLAIVNYALIPQVRMSELVAQCARALHWLMENAASLQVDAQDVSVSGHSAGGHLTAMMALETFPFPVRSMCAMSGIFDLAPIQQCFLNDVLKFTDAEIQDYSPVRHPPRHRGHFHVLTGADEGREYARQATDLVRAWSTGDFAPQLTLAPGHNHFSLRAALGDPNSEVIKHVLYASRL